MLCTDNNSGIAFGYVFRMNHMRFSILNFMTINKHISKLCFVVLCIKLGNTARKLGMNYKLVKNTLKACTNKG